MKKQNFFSSLLVSAVALTIAVPSLVNADPAGSPPGGNVDANFNTVTATGGYFVQADITNWFYNSGGHYGGSVAVNDPNGFISTGTSLVAGTFQGGTKGVDGSCNVGACAAGYFSATGAGGVGVSASSTNGVAGTFNGTNGGVSVTTTNFNAGDFTTFDSTSYALISQGANNFRGKILNTNAGVNSGKVQISDDDGFRIANTAGTAQFDVSGTTGDISDPNSEVTISDSMNVNSYASFYGGVNNYNGATKTGVMDVSGNLRTQGVITAGDSDLDLATVAPVTLSSTGIDLTGQLANSDTTNGGRVFVRDDIIQDAGHALYTDYVRGETYDPGTGTTTTNTLDLVGFPSVFIAASGSSGGSVILGGAPLAASGGGSYNSVTVKDPQGFLMKNYTTDVDSLAITQDGELSNLTANPVTLRDDNGMSVKNTFMTSTLMTLDGSGNLTVKGNVGQHYSPGWSAAVSAAPGAYATVSKSCNAGDYVTGCDFWLWNYLEQPRYVYMSDTLTCEMHFHNSDAVSQNGWVRPRCFSPDG